MFPAPKRGKKKVRDEPKTLLLAQGNVDHGKRVDAKENRGKKNAK